MFFNGDDGNDDDHGDYDYARSDPGCQRGVRTIDRFHGFDIAKSGLVQRSGGGIFGPEAESVGVHSGEVATQPGLVCEPDLNETAYGNLTD